MKDIPEALKSLFLSRIRIRLLGYLLSHSNTAFYTRQLEKLLDEPSGLIGRELVSLEKAGILTSTVEGNRKYYHINRSLSFFDELRVLFLKATVGEVIRAALAEENAIELAFIYGSFAKAEEREESDIDLMIVGQLSDRQINRAISNVERELERPINYSLYDRDEVRERLKNKENFISTVFSEPRILLIGTKDDELFRT